MAWYIPNSTAKALIIMTLAHILLLFTILSNYQPLIDPTEQEALYSVLSSINPDIEWRTVFPGDLCRKHPPGVVCRNFYFNFKDLQPTSHVTELNFGDYVSDEKPFLPCSHNATLNPILFTHFNYLRKLTFNNCFKFNNPENPINFSLSTFPPSLELLFIVKISDLIK